MSTKYDLTKYAEFVRAAMTDNRKADEHYTWSIKAINKGSIKFNWSYLSKAEEFILTVRESDGEPYVLVELPCGCSNVCILVGEDRWCDAKTIEMGIYKAITVAANKARHLF